MISLSNFSNNKEPNEEENHSNLPSYFAFRDMGSSPKLNTKVETFPTQNYDHNSSSQKLSSIKSDLSQPLLRHLDSYEIQENLCNKKNIYVLTDIRKGNKYILKIDGKEKKKILKIRSKLEGLDEWKDYLVLEDLSIGSKGILIKPGEIVLRHILDYLKSYKEKNSFKEKLVEIDCTSLKSDLEEIFINEKKHLTQINFLKLIFKIVHDSSKALSILHEKRIFHWDLKPENLVFYEDAKNFKLIDFGTSNIQKFAQSYEPVENKSEGYTIQYAAPERYDIERKIQLETCIEDPLKCDIFSLGKIIQEFIEESKKLETNSEQSEICYEFYSFFQELKPKLLQNDPEQRPSAKEIQEILENFLHNIGLNKEELMKDVINFLKYFPLEEMQPVTDLNINKRFEILNQLNRNDKSDFLHLYYDKTFLQKLTISPKLGSYSPYQLDYNMNKFFQIYLDLSTSSFIDDASYYYKLYISKYIDIAMLCETFGNLYYNLGRYEKALEMYTICIKENKKEKKVYEVLIVKLYAAKCLFFLKNRMDEIVKIRKEYKESKTRYLNTHLQALYYEIKALALSNKNYQKINKYYSKSLKIRENLLGKGHPAILKFQIRYVTENTKIPDRFEIASEVQRISEQQNFSVINIHSSYWISYTYYIQGKFKESFDYLEKNVNLAKTGTLMRNTSPDILIWNWVRCLCLDKLNIDKEISLKVLRENENNIGTSEFDYKPYDYLRFYLTKIRFLKELNDTKYHDEILEALKKSREKIINNEISSYEQIGYFYMHEATVFRDIKHDYRAAIRSFEESEKYYFLDENKMFTDFSVWPKVLKALCLDLNGSFLEAFDLIKKIYFEHIGVFEKSPHRMKFVKELYTNFIENIGLMNIEIN